MTWECKGGGNFNVKNISWELDFKKKIARSVAVLKDGKRDNQSTKILSISESFVVIEANDGTPYELYYEPNLYAVWKGKKIYYGNCIKTSLTAKNLDTTELEKQSNSIEFNIAEKKQQCEAIGFKPETEKFADCVLRLVELDVKQQTQNQIAVAQNNGNDALVKQLQRQNNLQSSQALIDLGQQLMNPKRYNSNIYMPQTQRCFMQGFGTFATMSCR